MLGQGALAAAVGPQHRNELAFVHRDGRAVHGQGRFGGVAKAHALGVDHMLHYFSSPVCVPCTKGLRTMGAFIELFPSPVRAPFASHRAVAPQGTTPPVLDTGRRVLIGGDPVQDGNIFMFGPQRNLPAYYYSLKRLEQYTDRFDEIWPSHASCPVKPSLIGELIRGTERLVRGEIQPEAAEFHGVPVKRFDVGAAGLLCDADIRLPEIIA